MKRTQITYADEPKRGGVEFVNMVPLLAAALLLAAPKPSCCAGMGAFLTDPAFAKAHQRPLRFKFHSTEGSMITFAGPEGAHQAFWVKPNPSIHTAIIMVHEWWGLNDYVKREAVRLHDSTGYAVLAIDLYHGKVAQTPEEAGRLMQAVDASDATRTIKTAIADLDAGAMGERVTKLGTIGWCFGGGWSLTAAIEGESHVKACVMYYGMPDDSPQSLRRLQAPVLMVEALKDKWISPEVVSKFKSAMAEAGKSLTVRTYDADHAFANPSNPHFEKADAEDAMNHTLEFFKKQLG